MSSHREAPEISKDPSADNTDVYAFVSPDRKDTVTLIANFIPLQQPNSGPNFFEFADDVSYEIRIANSGSGYADIRYQFLFHTKIRNPKTFLYNTGQIKDISDTTWNRPQYYSVTRWENGRSKVLASNLKVPPVNVGVRSTPDYQHLSDQAVHTVGSRKVFAGQRADAFHVDLGSVFDLLGLRPFNESHIINTPPMNAKGVNGVQSYNVHTIAIQVPISEVSRNGDVPTNQAKASAVIGVWAAARRKKSKVFDRTTGKHRSYGPWEQVSRLGNPLFNEVITPMAEKDAWNAHAPHGDKQYAKYVNNPEIAGLLVALYQMPDGSTLFPNLKKFYVDPKKKRADLNAILLTGIPKGVIEGFQNYTGPIESDMLRLNLAIPPKAGKPNNLGILEKDLAGFPNGRRLTDDVVAIELKAFAGATLPLVDKSYTADDAAGKLNDGTSNTNAGITGSFPYLGLPGSGYQTVPGRTKASGSDNDKPA